MLRRLLTTVSFVTLASISLAQERLQDVIYGKQTGVALTMDVFKPAKPNGMGVIWIVSGGWVSNHAGINPIVAKPLTDRGITVFQVVHGSQPKYIIPEIVDQVQRAVRFIKTNAATYGVDPERLGITGASAGGHLSLMVGGQAEEGKADASDPVERASASVKAVVAYYPPTDFMNFGANASDAIKDPKLAIFLPAFGVNKDTPADRATAIGRAASPILLANAKFPATLIIHGDKDPLVPLQQAKAMDDALGKAGADHKLVVVPNGGHDPQVIISTYDQLVAWFEAKLKK
ncbi:MAG: alpha/beta hydrolase fold domain-containing protein [Fimbriimonas sp.]